MLGRFAVLRHVDFRPVIEKALRPVSGIGDERFAHQALAHTCLAFQARRGAQRRTDRLSSSLDLLEDDDAEVAAEPDGRLSRQYAADRRNDLAGRIERQYGVLVDADGPVTFFGDLDIVALGGDALDELFRRTRRLHP